MDTKRHKSNFINEEINPCIQESQLSTKCLEENYYIHDKCVYHFQNYQICKKFWSKVAEMRRRKGIKPYMPGPVEREKIKKEVDESEKFVYAAV